MNGRTLVLGLFVAGGACAAVSMQEVGSPPQTAGEEQQNMQDHGDLQSTLSIQPRVSPSGPDHFLTATFTLRNQTDRPIPFTFSSGQQYDFSILDEGGRRYWRWSDDRMFTMAIVERSLGSEPWVYEEKIPTVDVEGRPLAPGRYWLEARLTADRTLRHRLDFEIR